MKDYPERRIRQPTETKEQGNSVTFIQDYRSVDALVVHLVESGKDWILDSGYTSIIHMTPNYG